MRKIALFIRLLLVIATFLRVFLATSVAYGQEPTTLAIMNFTNRSATGEWQWLSKGLADMLITDLSQTSDLQVVERERMQKLFEEMALSTTGIIDNATAARFGKVAKVDTALFGSFLKERDNLSIETHIIDVASGELLRVEWVRGKAEDVFKLEKQLAFKIIRNLHVKLTKAERESIRYTPTDSIDASEHFYRGIDFYDNGDYSQAWVECRGALGKDNRFIKAAYWVGKLYADLGEIAHAELAYRTVLDKFPDEHISANVLLDVGSFFENMVDDPGSAILAYEKVIAKYPDRSISQQDLANLSAKDKRSGCNFWSFYKLMRSRQRAVGRHAFLRKKFYRQALSRVVPLYEKIGDDIKAYGRAYRTCHDPYADLYIKQRLYALYQKILDKGQDRHVKPPLEVNVLHARNPVFSKNYLSAERDKRSEDYTEYKEPGKDSIRSVSDYVLLQAPEGYSIASMVIKMDLDRHNIPPSCGFEVNTFIGPQRHRRRLIWFYLWHWREGVWLNALTDKKMSIDDITNGELAFALPRNMRLIQIHVHSNKAREQQKLGLKGWKIKAKLVPFTPPQVAKVSPSGIKGQNDGDEKGSAQISIYHPSHISLLNPDLLREKIRGPFSTAKKMWHIASKIDGQPWEKGSSQPFVCSPGNHTIELIAWMEIKQQRKQDRLYFPVRRRQITAAPGEKKQIGLSPFHDFSAPMKLSETGLNPRLFKDRRGRIWALWQESPSQEVSQIFFSFSDNEGDSWSPPQKASISSTYHDRSPCLVQNETGTYWLVWVSDRDRVNMNAIYIARSRDGINWTLPKKVYPSDSVVQEKHSSWPREDFMHKPGMSFLVNQNASFLLFVRNICLISSDGKRWEEHVIEERKNPSRIIQMRNGYYAKLYGGFFSVSKDGLNWSEKKKVLYNPGSPRAYGMGVLEDNSGRFIVYGDDRYTTSEDGKTWAIPMSPLGCVTYSPKKRLALHSLTQSESGKFLAFFSGSFYGRYYYRDEGGVYFCKGTYIRNPSDVLEEFQSHETNSTNQGEIR